MGQPRWSHADQGCVDPQSDMLHPSSSFSFFFFNNPVHSINLRSFRLYTHPFVHSFTRSGKHELSLHDSCGCKRASIRIDPYAILRYYAYWKLGPILIAWTCGRVVKALDSGSSHESGKGSNPFGFSKTHFFRGSIVASILACHARDQGSIPCSGVTISFFLSFLFCPALFLRIVTLFIFLQSHKKMNHAKGAAQFFGLVSLLFQLPSVGSHKPAPTNSKKHSLPWVPRWSPS